MWHYCDVFYFRFSFIISRFKIVLWHCALRLRWHDGFSFYGLQVFQEN